MTAKKRNPQDATLRNIRALKARVKELEATVLELAADVADSAVTSARLRSLYDQLQLRIPARGKKSR